MSTSVILSACRTPIGKYQGVLSSVPATELGASVIAATLKASNIDGSSVDEVIFGVVLPAGQGQAPARQAALKAQIPPHVAALTINKVCGSSLKAVMLANQSIRCGDTTVIVAGGMESMSRAPWLVERQLQGLGNKALVDSMLHDGLFCGMSHLSMGQIADQLAEREGISRVEQDRYSCESHRRAYIAIQQNVFQQEIVPIEVTVKSSTKQVVIDEGPRSDCTVEKLATLRPSFGTNGTVTAGNAAMISDGAAAVAVASADFAKAHGLKPLAEIIAATTAGLKPEDLFVAPVEAIRKLLARTGYTVADIDLWEINEAFAVQVLACQRPLEIPDDKLNICGGAIALGHPIGASGARVLATLVHSLHRTDRELGIASLCLGGGNAVAMLIRRLG